MSEFSKCLLLVNTNTQTEAKTKEISWVKAFKNVPLAATWWSFGFQCDESPGTLSHRLAMSNGHRRQCVESCGIKTWLWLVWLLATGKLPTGVFTFKCFTLFYHVLPSTIWLFGIPHGISYPSWALAMLKRFSVAASFFFPIWWPRSPSSQLLADGSTTG